MARWTALGEPLREKDAAAQRGIDASAARYTALADDYYAAKNEDIQQGIDADAARYTALAG